LKDNEAQVPQVLHHAALSANQCIRGYVSDHPESYGIGATLVAPMFIEDRLYWVSVGDSPLYLFRDGKLKQLNEDHSLAPEIDLMVRSGMMTEEQGRNHPDRNCLKSVIFGSEIARVDCPREPFKVEQDDIFVASSDGLQTLTDAEIEAILDDNRTKPSHAVVSALLAAVEKVDDPDQDNISISVIKVTTRTPVEVFDSKRHIPATKPRGVSMPTRVLQFVSGRRRRPIAFAPWAGGTCPERLRGRRLKLPLPQFDRFPPFCFQNGHEKAGTISSPRPIPSPFLP